MRLIVYFEDGSSRELLVSIYWRRDGVLNYREVGSEDWSLLKGVDHVAEDTAQAA